MPCDYEPTSVEIERRQREYQTMTRLSCDRCRELEARGGTVPEWAQEWWKEHKRRDDDRQQRETQTQREAEIRKRAISKLTPEERDELGV